MSFMSHVKRITIPRKLEAKLTDRKMMLIKREVQKPKQSGPVTISCKSKKLDHHKGQKYGNFKAEYLASAYWKNRRHAGDYFVMNANSKNPSFVTDKEVVMKFQDLGLQEEICDALKGYGIKTPTHVQRITIPAIFSGSNVLCTSETGSGKTLAYLLPIIQNILQQKSENAFRPAVNRPLGLVIVPSHELADQIEAVATDAAAHLGVQVASICGRHSYRFLNGSRRIMDKQMDILVASPGILSKALALKLLDLSRLRMVVLDEADTLLDDSFNYILSKIITRTIGQSSRYISDRFNTIVASDNQSESKDLKPSKQSCYQFGESTDINSNQCEQTTITQSSLAFSDSVTTDDRNDRSDLDIPADRHQGYSHTYKTKHPEFSEECEISGVDLNVLSSEDDSAQVPVLQVNTSLLTSTVQFCFIGATIPLTIRDSLGDLVPDNTIKTMKSRNVHHILPHVTQKFFRVTGDQKSEMVLQRISDNIRKRVPTIVFCNTVKTLKYLSYALEESNIKPVTVLYSDKRHKLSREGVFQSWEAGETDILLATDIASRGLDTVRAKVVINYDFPVNMADYIHRVGRLGRIGCDGTGVVINYIQYKWDIDLLWKIETSARREHELLEVDSNIKKQHKLRHAAKQEMLNGLN